MEAAKCPVIAAMDDQRQANGDGRATIDPAEKSDDDRTGTLRRRLRDTVEMCQRLATALDARHDSSTTHDVSQILSTNHSACTAQLIACSVDKVCPIAVMLSLETVLFQDSLDTHFGCLGLGLLGWCLGSGLGLDVVVLSIS